MRLRTNVFAIGKEDPYLQIGTFTNEEAFVLMDQGIWMESGGYKWRNKGEGGQYLAYGEYPECIRGAGAHTLEGVRKVGDDDWNIAVFDDLPEAVLEFLNGKKAVLI